METKTKLSISYLPRWIPTQAGLHRMATHYGLVRYWASLTPAEKMARLANNLHRPDVVARAEAARRPKLRGPEHRRRVSEGMKRYWARKGLPALMAKARQMGQELDNMMKEDGRL